MGDEIHGSFEGDMETHIDAGFFTVIFYLFRKVHVSIYIYR